MTDQEIREALNQHWTASNSGDFATEHDIYHEDAVLDYPNRARNGSSVWTSPKYQRSPEDRVGAKAS